MTDDTNGVDPGAVAKLVTKVDLAVGPGAGVDARFAFAVQVGDHNQQTVNVGVGPLVPPPGSTAAAMVDAATLGLRPPPVLKGLVARARRNRWLVVTGSPGSGKSSVVCALARPALCEGRVPVGPDPHFVHAVVALDATSTAWWLAEDLAAQFRVSIPRYAGAVAACRQVDPPAWDGLSLWEQRVTAPLAFLHRADTTRTDEITDETGPGTPAQVVRVVIDGWDQVAQEYAADVHEVVHRLAHEGPAVGPQSPRHSEHPEQHRRLDRGRPGMLPARCACSRSCSRTLVAVLSLSHPDTLTTRANIAVLRSQTGQCRGAGIVDQAPSLRRPRRCRNDHL